MTPSWCLVVESKGELSVPGCEPKQHPCRTRSCAHLPEALGNGSVQIARTSPSSTPEQQGLEKWAEPSTEQLAFYFFAHCQINLSFTLVNKLLRQAKWKNIYELGWSAVTHWFPQLFLIRASFAIFYLVLAWYSLHEQKVLQIFWAEFHLQSTQLQTFILPLSFWN